ncbi:uncharacterized protein KY384_007158 [Bacidia gigantensis]|uniref:uncharacterized protein n=1 Tax=Bacidia gigantensis TaxID=2732470 RepID=UPI001D047AAA|nr:uncharacterized protein KY384_007158 [Bacidia gigantensis]KAG8528241.1 hypothetical protein KY384_007158 [Bacidia gigantensis]
MYYDYLGLAVVSITLVDFEMNNEILPKASIDIKAIRSNPALYSQNCVHRRYGGSAQIPQQIVDCHSQWLELERSSLEARQKLKNVQTQIAAAEEDEKKSFLSEARSLRVSLEQSEPQQEWLQNKIAGLSNQLPNLSSDETPLGDKPLIIEATPPPDRNDDALRDHVRIGTQLDILDFSSAISTSGWGFYFLRKEAKKLARALVNYAESVVERHQYEPCDPPTLIYSQIAQACGYRPRDQNGEQQVYDIHRPYNDAQTQKPQLSLAGTAEIPLATMQANKTLQQKDLPARIVGSSRCYRAEAGARGRDTRGLYRVHEFTKVEMFAWTMPGEEVKIFDEMVSIQKEIITSLGLPFRLLEMPARELGASASRKRDIEVYFPSRKDLNGGWGEVTSASICTDYQTRRLNTRVKTLNEELVFPSTINGTAMAVPRILAAILENGWENDDVVRIPEALWPWMNGQKIIGKHKINVAS